MKQRRTKSGRGVLMILALFLASSGALRIGADVGEAMASTSDPDPVDTSPEILQCPQVPIALAKALSEREANLAAREQVFDDRNAALALADAAVGARLTELAAAEAELKATLAIADGAAEEDVARLTAVYEAMKPADAAALFQAMAPEFAAGFLGRMRPELAAAVMSGMTTDSAYSISVLIAGRNALAPKD